MSCACPMKSKPAYIVIDTNVLISAVSLPQSKTAQVLALGVTLVTNSEADFQGYAGLPIDNWVNRH